MEMKNEALWLDCSSGRLRTGPAPYTRPGVGEVVVRTLSVAVNPVDTMTWIQRRMVYPWLTYPAVRGTVSPERWWRSGRAYATSTSGIASWL